MIQLRLYGQRCADCGAPADAVRVGEAVLVDDVRCTGNVVEPCRCVLNLASRRIDGPPVPRPAEPVTRRDDDAVRFA